MIRVAVAVLLIAVMSVIAASRPAVAPEEPVSSPVRTRMQEELRREAGQAFPATRE